MIVETNSLTTISVGTAKSQTEPGDTALKIPNLILPSIELIEPTQVGPLGSQLMLSSFVRSQFVSRTNQIAGSTVFCTLGKGLWDLRFVWIHKMLYAAPIAFNTNGNVVQIVSPIGGISCVLASILPVQSGNFQTIWNNRLLLRDNAEIQLIFDATGVGDFLDQNLSLCASKLL